MVIRRKIWRFLKTAKCRKFLVECNWINRFSLNVQKFRIFVEKKYMGLSIKLLIFLKSLKVAKLHYNASETAKTLKTLKKFVVFKKYVWIFLEKNIFFSKKTATVIEFALICDWNFESSQNVQTWIFSKKTNGLFEKEGNFQNLPKVANLV